jgi:DMSO reductase anchor subunit
MNPAFSVVLLTMLIGAAQGLFLALFAAELTAAAPPATPDTLGGFLGLGAGVTGLLGLLTTLACAALFVCTGMISASIRFLQEWASPLTLVNYTVLGLASGWTLATALAALWATPIAAAFVLEDLGLLAERWFFFAHANHPQKLYYQAVS